MKAQWRTFLENAGAEFRDGEVASYGNPEQELSIALTGNVFADLSHLGLIAVHGADAQEFLQGQLANDVGRVDEAHSQINAYCSPKGRMLATFRLFRHGDAFYLRLPAALVEPVLKRLRMFVLRSQVTLEDASGAYVALGASGPTVDQELAESFGEVPQATDAVRTASGCTMLRLPGVHPRFEIYGPLDTMTKLWESLNVRAAPVGATSWALLDVMAGIPTVYPETSDAFVPQMANLQLVGGVSFAKGCYPGQEVVARMEYLGKLKRRMYLALVRSETAPRPGDELFAPDSPGQSVGRVVDAQPHPDGAYATLGVIQIANAEGGEVRYGAADGPPLDFRPLPYTLESVGAGGAQS
ncbi:MAG TPA: folate-binding protein [Gammaproteobacteria bacterium]|nr:folate-binding protein [Gammaproteobacteria bacterium]